MEFSAVQHQAVPKRGWRTSRRIVFLFCVAQMAHTFAQDAPMFTKQRVCCKLTMAAEKTRAILARCALPPPGTCCPVQRSRNIRSTWKRRAGPPIRGVRQHQGDSSISNALDSSSNKRLFMHARKGSQRASTLQRLLGTSVDKSGWGKGLSTPNSDTADVSQHDSTSKASQSDSSTDAYAQTDTTSDLQDEAQVRSYITSYCCHVAQRGGAHRRCFGACVSARLHGYAVVHDVHVCHPLFLLQASYWSTWHHTRGFGSAHRVSSETGTDSSCSSHAATPASPSGPQTMSPVSSDAAQIDVAAVSGENTHEAAVRSSVLPASVLPAFQDQARPLDVASANARCDIAQLPLQYQPSVLVQAYKYGLVSWQDLQQASSSPLYPQILIGDESTKLVKQIKRKVALNNHADKVASMSKSCEIYHRFNGRVDELLKPGRSPEGLLKYQHALCMEREAAGQCLLWLRC